MRTSCLKHFIPSPDRFAYNKKETVERKEAAPEAEKKAPGGRETLDKKYEKAEALLKQPVNIKENPLATMLELAKRMGEGGETAALMVDAFQKNYEKHKTSTEAASEKGTELPTFEEFWKSLSHAGYRIAIVKSDGEWVFQLTNPKGESIDTKLGAIGEATAVAIDEPPKKPKKTEEKEAVTEAPPEQQEALNSFKEIMGAGALAKVLKNQVGIGARYELPWTRDLQIYTEKGKSVNLDYEKFGEYRKAVAVTTKAYRIRWKNITYVFVNAEIDGSMKAAKYSGWIQENRLLDRDVSGARKIERRVKVEVSEEKLEQKKKLREMAEQAEEARKPYWDKETGLVTFKGTTAEKWRQSLNVKLNTLFPDAREGARVMVTRAHDKKPRVATFDGTDWKYDSGERAKIFHGYKVIPMWSLEYREEKPNAPRLPGGYKFLDHAPAKLTQDQIEQAKKGTLHWNLIAGEIMKKYPDIQKNGYSVGEYAKILAKYATDTGYYWIILPPKTERVIEREAKAEVKKQKEAAEKRTKKGTSELETLAASLYKKNGTRLWGDEKWIPPEKIRDLISDEKAWMEAWEKGYPIDSRRIEAAFDRPPFDKIPKQKLPKVLRKVMHYTIGKNGISFSYFMEAFNKPEHPIYKTFEGKLGSLSDMQDDVQMILDARKKVAENKKEGKAINAGMSKTEFTAYLVGPKRMEEMVNISKTALLVFESLMRLRHESEKPAYAATEKFTMNERDKQLVHYYRVNIYGDKDGDAVGLLMKEGMAKTIDSKEKWDEMWDKDQGNIGLLKKQLRERYPYNKIALNRYRDLLHKTLKSYKSTFYLNLETILDAVNDDGELYKTIDGEPGDFDDFREEYTKADIVMRLDRGDRLSEKEIKYYHEEIKNPQSYRSKYRELAELWASTAHVLHTMSQLDPSKSYAESLKPSERPQAFLDEIFPPSDTGSIGEEGQDYYDTYVAGGKTVAKGGLFGTGLFKFDYSDEKSKISRLDMTTSGATANAIIMDQCRTGEKLDQKKVENRLNQLIHIGIAALIAEPDSLQRTANLKLLGLTPETAKRKNVVAETAKIVGIDFSKTKHLAEIQKNLIRLGFIVELKAKPGEVAEGAPEKVEWSSDPEIRKIQRYALEQGFPPEQMKEIERKVDQHMLAFFHLTFEKNFKGVNEAGITVPVQIAGDDKNKLFLALGVAYNFGDGQVKLRVGVGTSVEIAKNLSFIAGAGGGVGIGEKGVTGEVAAGLGLTYNIPVDENTVWEPSLTIGAAAGVGGIGAVPVPFIAPGAAVLWSRNLNKEYQQEVKEKLAESAYAKVEEAKTIPEKAEALRGLPEPYGSMFMQLQYNMKLSDAQLVNLYEEHFKQMIKETVQKEGQVGVFEPVAFGVGAGVVFSKNAEPVFVPGIALAVAVGSKLVVFQSPRTTTTEMIQRGESGMTAQAENRIKRQYTEFQKAAASAGYTVEYRVLSEALVGDMETGLKPVKVEQSSTVHERVKTADEEMLEKEFKKLQAELLTKGMKLTKIGKMYKLEVLNIGNMQLYVDPQMKERAGIFLKNNGDIMISASNNPNLVIKRLDMYYPRPKNGNIKHTIITISDQDFRSQQAIMAESDFYLDTRTEDNTGHYRKKLQYEWTGTRKKPAQWNLRRWKGEKDTSLAAFDNLETVTPQTRELRKLQEKIDRHAKLGDKLREYIGEANLEGVDLNDMRARAEKFMKSHPTEYRKLTTYEYRKPGDLQKLYDLISKENPDLQSDPDKIHAVMEELFNLSMLAHRTRTEKLPEERKKAEMLKIIRQRVAWMKQLIYIPFFKKHLNPSNNPHGYTAQEVAEAFLAPIRKSNLDAVESIPVGGRIDVAVGTMRIFGRRGFTVAHPENIPDHKLYPAQDYISALETGQPLIDKTIALVLRESQSPVETIDRPEDFLASPLAMKLMLLGTKAKSPILAEALGEENYEQLTECYKTRPPQVLEEAKPAILELIKVVRALRQAQEGINSTVVLLDGVAYQTIVVNGVRIGIRTSTLKSGVYERCLNASNVYDDSLIALGEHEQYKLVGNMRAYSARSTTTLITEYRVAVMSFGIGAAAPVGPEAPPPPPPGDGGGGETPPPPEGGPGGKVEQRPGGRGPTTIDVTVPDTPIGTGEQGQPGTPGGSKDAP